MSWFCVFFLTKNFFLLTVLPFLPKTQPLLPHTPCCCYENFLPFLSWPWNWLALDLSKPLLRKVTTTPFFILIRKFFTGYIVGWMLPDIFENIRSGFCHWDSYCGEQEIRSAWGKGKSARVELLAEARWPPVSRPLPPAAASSASLPLFLSLGSGHIGCLSTSQLDWVFSTSGPFSLLFPWPGTLYLIGLAPLVSGLFPVLPVRRVPPWLCCLIKRTL